MYKNYISNLISFILLLLAIFLAAIFLIRVILQINFKLVAKFVLIIYLV